MLLCSQGSKLQKTTEQYQKKNCPNKWQRSISPVNENSETKFALTIYPNYDKSKIFNSPNIKRNTIKTPLKVLYTSIHGLLPHQLFHLNIHPTFRLAHEKHETPKDCAAMLKVKGRDTIQPLSNNFEQDPFHSLKI